MITFATKKLSTGANGLKEDAASFFSPRSFDQAVMASSSVVRSTTRDAGDPGTKPGFDPCKQWSCDYPIDVPATPMLPDDNLRYQEAQALDWRK